MDVDILVSCYPATAQLSRSTIRSSGAPPLLGTAFGYEDGDMNMSMPCRLWLMTSTTIIAAVSR